LDERTDETKSDPADDPAQDDEDDFSASAPEQTLVIVGNGMMSWKLCQKLVECGAQTALRIVVFGEEPRPAYDRVHLTELFSGKTTEMLTLAPIEWYEDNGIELYLNDPVVLIDREECRVRSASGMEVLYDRLVFATGSRPFVPPMEGTSLPGVFVYRTVEDLYDIMDYARESARAAVIGGGLLGLEAAKAVYDLGLEVHVIEFAPGLMPRQLDARGAQLLRDKIEELGVSVHVQKQTKRIEAEGGEGQRGERILHFADGGRLAVDMVVISAGIRPRGDLADAAGLECAKNGGIVVDDHLTTSDPRLFAVGECAVHRGTTYGLALPGYRMVEILVDNLVGGTATFEGTDQSAKLKLMGVVVASIGEHNENEAARSTANYFLAHGVYRKLVMRDGKIIGAISVGEWDNLDRVRSTVEELRLVSFWDMRRFRSTGNLWARSESPPVHQWDVDAAVCGCMRVTRGVLSQAVSDGCTTVDEVCLRTGAGTMCGSCKPLIAELLAGGRDPGAHARWDSIPPPARDPSLRAGRDAGSALMSESSLIRRGSVPPGRHDSVMPPPDAASAKRVSFHAPESDLAPPSRRLPFNRVPFAGKGELAEEDDAEPPSREAMMPPPEKGMPLHDSILPPPGGIPRSLRDMAPSSVRDMTSLRLSDPGALLMQEAARRDSDDDNPAEPVRDSGSRPVSRARRDSIPPGRRDSIPPGRRDSIPPGRRDSVPPGRRDSVPPLRPLSTLSVPPTRSSIPPGGAPAPGRISIAPGRISSPEAGISTTAAEERVYKPLLAASIIGLILPIIIAVAAPISGARTARIGFHIQALWTESAWKQVSGYVALALCVVSMLLSLRKRVKRFEFSNVATLRLVHGMVAVLALVVLVFHTGLHLGQELNRMLMIEFLALAVLGAAAGGVTALSHWFSPVQARNQRTFWWRAHLILFWPLPILLVLHIMTAYFY
jgi:nitrite reductase (NADH) large subunit